MKTKRIVITGGPGSGKSTLVHALEDEGYTCMHEVSREVILEARASGVDQMFLKDPLLFSEALLKGRMEQFHDLPGNPPPFYFYDRGLPDITAYLDYTGMPYTERFSEPCMEYRYDMVFLLPPWQQIYLQDNERYETFEEAERISRYLLEAYQGYGYNVINVPVGTVSFRTRFILKQIRENL